VAALAGLPESPQLARALARQSQIEMLQQRPESIDHASEAIAVARRVGDSFAELNATINLSTQQATRGIAPDPDEIASIVDAAVEAGEYEEGYRAIVNFVWSGSGYLPIDEIERVVSGVRRRLANVPSPGYIRPYLEVSVAMWLLVPSARWTEADALLAEFAEREQAATTQLAFLTVAGGLAFRRGETQASREFLEELRPPALASGELQRIVPMAGVVLPWLARTGELEELRSLTDEVLAVADRRWPAVLDAVPVVRALSAAGELDLLARAAESIRETPTSRRMNGRRPSPRRACSRSYKDVPVRPSSSSNLRSSGSAGSAVPIPRRASSSTSQPRSRLRGGPTPRTKRERGPHPYWSRSAA
jgi:hypothetical protein